MTEYSLKNPVTQAAKMFRLYLASFVFVYVSGYTTLPNGAVESVVLNPEKSPPKVNLDKDVKTLGEHDRNAVGTARKWPKGVVPYVFDSSLSETSKQAVLAAIKDFNNFTCIRWVPRTNQTNYVSFMNGGDGACYSYVGIAFPDKQDLSLGKWCDHKGVAEHEMMHALGFDHEQNRPDRDKFVNILTENIDESGLSQFIKTENALLFGIAYDFGSVLHYRNDSFTKNSKLTITRKDGKPLVAQRLGLSDYDVKKINLFYEKCTK